MSLRLSGIDFTYPGSTRPVLTGLHLDIGAGETVAVMAPSGTGKTTLLGVAGLLLEPQRGTVSIGGRDRTVRDAPNLLGREIAFVLQTVNLLPRRTVLDNVTLPSIIAGNERAHADLQALELLDALDLREKAGREARTLSGGQAQRVGIARALINRPALLIADEPTANLDIATAHQVTELMLSVERGSTAILLATHDPAVARQADRTVTLGESPT